MKMKNHCVVFHRELKTDYSAYNSLSKLSLAYMLLLFNDVLG